MDVPTRTNLYVKVEERLNINKDQDKNYTYEDQIRNTELSRYTFPDKNSWTKILESVNNCFGSCLI